MAKTIDNKLKILIILLVLLSISLRVISISHSNDDLTKYNLPWYQTLYQQGIGKTLATDFSNYSPPYTYFLALATLTHDFLPPVIALKLIPICFDLIGAFYLYKIVKLKFKQDNTPSLAAAIYFTAPTVILNSTYWGQVDSLYTSLLLACLYFLLTESPLTSMLAFGMAFSIKAQAVFFLPFLVVMAIRKRIPWLYFGLIPLVYLIVALPVVLLGRPLLETLLIYTTQTSTYARLAVNAPNLYFLFPTAWYSLITPTGIILAIILLLWWMYSTAKNSTDLDPKNIILIAFLSTALMPFLLPKMHDRYFYPADVLSIALAFYWPTLWFIPVLYQIISTFSISVFLFNGSSTFVILAALLNTITIAMILRTQKLTENRRGTNQKASFVFSWLTTILTPMILFGLCLNLLLTPYFIKFQYALPSTPINRPVFSKSERFKWASQTVGYLTNNKPISSIKKLKFENGSSVFNNNEVLIIDSAKNTVGKTLTAWRLSLIGSFILALLAWMGDWLPKFRYAVKQGGWLTIWLAIISALMVVFGNIINQGSYLQSTGSLTDLFPAGFWLTSFIFMVLGTISIGAFLIIGLRKIDNKSQD